MFNQDHSHSISIIKFMIFDQNNSNSLTNMVTRARENARSVQEHISRELWVSVNKYYNCYDISYPNTNCFELNLTGPWKDSVYLSQKDNVNYPLNDGTIKKMVKVCEDCNEIITITDLPPLK